MQLPNTASRHVPVWAAWVALAVGVVLSGAAWFGADRVVANEVQVEFVAEARDAVGDISGSMERKVDLLQGLRGLSAAADGISRKRFREFAQALETSDGFPGLRGLHFVRPVALANIDAYER